MFLNYINIYTAFILIGGLTFLIFFVWRYFCYTENDCQLGEDGLKVLYLGGLLKVKVRYDQIESVVLLPFLKFFFSTLHFRCMVSGLWRVSRASGNVVIVKKKRAVVFGYIIISPKDETTFVEQLQRRINEAKATSSQMSQGKPQPLTE
jgi:hypothetical protein